MTRQFALIPGLQKSVSLSLRDGCDEEPDRTLNIQLHWVLSQDRNVLSGLQEFYSIIL